jgi:hypothetical protein
VNKVLNNIKLGLSSSTIDARFTLIEFVIEGVMQQTSDPTEWKS